MDKFKNAVLGRKEFVVTCEHVPGRGLKGKKIDNIVNFAEQIAGSKLIHALSLTDNAGGNPAFSADMLAFHIIAMGIDVIVHFSCKDMNRNAIEARAYALKKCGLTNLLVISGDYPISGFLGIPKPVFDIDSVIALHYLKRISKGLEIKEGRKLIKLDGTDFFLGAATSSFKYTEASLVMQYKKMEKKIRAGADYIIPQLGYDTRKHIELIQYIRNHLNSDIPVIGSVYLLSAGAGRFMNKGGVPGCYVSDEMFEKLKEEAKSPDKGKGAILERAAQQTAIIKGLGYSGVHIEGLNLKFEDVKHILGRAEEIGDNWRDHVNKLVFAPENPYFLFKDGEQFKDIVKKEDLKFNETRRRAVISLNFWIYRMFHKLIFMKGTIGYKFVRVIVKFISKKKILFAIFGFFERAFKKMTLGCRECDDCAIFETYYLCPESKCPKGMRIGPCGGSRVDGRCEVFEKRYCLWEKVYWRAKNRKQLEKLEYIINPRDWGLYETSSWANYFLSLDHSAKTIDFSGENN